MATSNPPIGSRGELDLLGVGTSVDTLDKTQGNPWVHNMVYRDGRYRVRKGFGTLARYSTTLGSGRATTAGQTAPANVVGYTSIVGAAYMVTKQGHEQIIQVCTLKAYSSDYQDDTGGTWTSPFGQFQTTVVLSVYVVPSAISLCAPFLV